MEWLYYILAAIVVIILLGALFVLPDLRRYFRIRKM
jgi:hypothetical protein